MGCFWIITFTGGGKSYFFKTELCINELICWQVFESMSLILNYNHRPAECKYGRDFLTQFLYIETRMWQLNSITTSRKI